MTISRRDYLAASAALVAAAFAPRAALAQTTIRQGYQTNLWGMPTYYLLRSGLLEKRGIKFEEFGVPSGNLTGGPLASRSVSCATNARGSFSIWASSSRAAAAPLTLSGDQPRFNDAT